MKLGEKIHIDHQNNKIIVEQTHTANPELNRAKALRNAGVDGWGENKLVGTIPVYLIKQWCEEEGIKWSDIHARQEIVKKRILSGEFDKLRVWKGTY